MLGGSFDPIHRAHLQLARVAHQQLALDELRLVVAAQPAQKPKVSAVAHRLRMVELAIADQPPADQRWLAIERCETERPGASYTIETLIELRARYGTQALLIWIIGGDQYRNLATWHRHQELTDYADFAVAERPGSPAQATPSLPPAITLTRPHGQFVKLEMPPIDCSSTDIRAAIAKRQPVGADLSPSVLAYIHTHQLYTDTA